MYLLTMGKNMAMTLIPRTHDTDELLPTNVIVKCSLEEEKQTDIDNIEEKTYTHVIVKCSLEEEKQADIDNIEEKTYTHMNLPITNNIGDTLTNLASLISHYIHTLNRYNLRNLGYPTNQDFNYDVLTPLFHFHLNNAGDPFLGSSFSLNSTAFEVCVLDWFANLWEIEKNEYWGYVTTGGTEGNLHGILVGREQLPDGILYTSEDSHYSIFKIARMYRMECVKVRTLVSGEIDCIDLKALLVAHNDKPAIINLNIGTTMKGGVDDLDLVIQILQECGFTSDRFYIHCDGALFGTMLPFIERAPRISFKKGIGSVAISGHKFLGCPIPCGIVIIKALSRDVEYIASRDVTITGSRCGSNFPLVWHQKKSFSNIVVFEKPLDENFTRRWNLACTGNIAHVVVMQHVTSEMLDSFVREFLQKRTIWFKDGWFQPLCVANDIGSSNCASLDPTIGIRARSRVRFPTGAIAEGEIVGAEGYRSSVVDYAVMESGIHWWSLLSWNVNPGFCGIKERFEGVGEIACGMLSSGELWFCYRMTEAKLLHSTPCLAVYYRLLMDGILKMHNIMLSLERNVEGGSRDARRLVLRIDEYLEVAMLWSKLSRFLQQLQKM
ncbi:hypothetical protein Fmac_023673 [Flemingia macrophylla]|uniref:Histidine decarboxylase n=1 Tax=Flemingia macrophylla TaxID=520843 RepID=A0ABD1LM80_9FABA